MILTRVISLLFLISPLIALTQLKDAGMWCGLGFSAELNKKIDVSISPEIRLNENLSRVASSFSDVGLQYKINKKVVFQATYRGGVRNNTDAFDLRQRLQLGFSFKKKLKDFAISFQPKWQTSIAQYNAESDVDFVTTMRNKLKVQYSGLKKIDVTTSIELFNSLSPFTLLTLQNWRWIASAERSFSKTQSITLGYLIQKDVSSSPQEIDYVFLLSYQFKFDLKKKNKDDTENEPKN